MHSIVHKYTRIRAHMHVPHACNIGVHGSREELRELVPKMEAALPLCTVHIIYHRYILDPMII